jgi:hypothetical protein
MYREAWGHRVRAYPWPEIADFFRGVLPAIPALAPMLRLVEQIEASPYRDRFHAITSMHTLRVASTPEFDSGGEVLLVGFDIHRGEFAFEYIEQPYVDTRWRKRCPPEEGFSALLHFARLKRWFDLLPPEG